MAKKLKLAAFKDPIDGVPGVLLDLGSGTGRSTELFTAEIDGESSDDQVAQLVREAVQHCAQEKILVLTEQPVIEQDDEKGAAIQVALHYYLLEEAPPTPVPYSGNSD